MELPLDQMVEGVQFGEHGKLEPVFGPLPLAIIHRVCKWPRVYRDRITRNGDGAALPRIRDGTRGGRRVSRRRFGAGVAIRAGFPRSRRRVLGEGSWCIVYALCTHEPRQRLRTDRVGLGVALVVLLSQRCLPILHAAREDPLKG